MPILLPIIFDKDFEYNTCLYRISNSEKNYEKTINNNVLETDLAAKQKLMNFMIQNCVISIKMSEV